MPTPWTLDPDRIFSPEPRVRTRARELYEGIRDLPILAPHGHVEPALLADPDARFANPAELFIIPDHYVFRMLHSQGVPMASLGVPRRDGGPVETDPRAIWRTFWDRIARSMVCRRAVCMVAKRRMTVSKRPRATTSPRCGRCNRAART